MLDPEVLIPFVVASAILVAIPGPAVLYIVSTGIARGRGSALASMAGIESGAMVHVLAATVGLSALVTSSALAFSVLKYAGAAYLILLGIRTLRAGAVVELAPRAGVSNLRSYGRGVVVNVLNPKVALFFLAYLPQFVDPGRGSVAFQLLTLGLVFVTVAILIDSAYALSSGTIGSLLQRRPSFSRAQNRVAGVTYIALGATAALTGSKGN